jgi:hypothetical protein
MFLSRHAELLKGDPNCEGGDFEIDVFDFPEADADELFVNPFLCTNVSVCQWKELQDIAVNGGAEADAEAALIRAGAGPRQGALVYLTPRQAGQLRQELQRLGFSPDPVAVEACAYYVRDCLHRARMANGRQMGPLSR